MVQAPPPPEPPQKPEAPWYARKSAPLSAEEVDDWDREMAPQRAKPRGSIFSR